MASVGVAGARGQVLALTAGMLLGILAVVGLATDAGLIFSARRALQGAADAAATAAAQQVDVAAYRRSDGQVVHLDPSAAYAAAVARLQASPRVQGYSVWVNPTQVNVVVRGSARLAFLPAVIPVARSVPVKAEARATPRYGIAGDVR